MYTSRRRPDEWPIWAAAIYNSATILALPFVVPRHLDRLQDPLVRFLRVVGELGQLGDRLVHVGEPDRQRVGLAELLEQQLPDGSRVLPGQRHGVTSSACRAGPSSVLRACGPSPRRSQLPP